MTTKIAKTREDYLATMQEQRSAAEALCASYNEAFQSGDFKKAGEIEDSIKDAIKEHNTAARAVFAHDALAADAPLLFIVNGFRYTIIKTKTDKVGDEKTPVLSIVTVETRFDITSFNRKTCTTIGADPAWFFRLEALTYACTKETATGIGYDSARFKSEIGEFFKISDDGKGIKLEVSNNKLKAALVSVISAMLGEDYGKQVIGADVRFFREAFSSYDWKKSSLKAASLKQIGFIICDIAHRIVTGGAYDLTTKMVKVPKN